MQMGTLRLFCDVVETKNFTRAVEKNGVSQPHASFLFHALEREMGARLTVRDTAAVSWPSVSGPRLLSLKSFQVLVADQLAPLFIPETEGE